MSFNPSAYRNAQQRCWPQIYKLSTLLRPSRGKHRWHPYSQPSQETSQRHSELSRKQTKPICRRRMEGTQEARPEDRACYWISTASRFSNSVLFPLVLTLQIILNPRGTFKYEVQSHLFCTVFSNISYCLYNPLRLYQFAVVHHHPPVPLLQTPELPKDISWPPSPFLTAFSRLREAVKGNKILIQEVWANARVWS